MEPDGQQRARIRFEDRQGYLYAFVSGKHDSLDLSLDYWQRVVDECRRRGFTKLLVEESFPNQLSAAQIYTLTAAIAKMPVTELKIAFVDQKSDQEALNLFGETVAVNRGVYGRVFKELEGAEAWLGSS